MLWEQGVGGLNPLAPTIYGLNPLAPTKTMGYGLDRSPFFLLISICVEVCSYALISTKILQVNND